MDFLAAFSLLALLSTGGDLPEIRTRGALRVLMVPVSPTDEFFASPGGAQPGMDREILEAF